MSFRRVLLVVAPPLFVLIWATGWIVAKEAAFHADPLLFLSVRFACATVALALLALALGATWPRTGAAIGPILVSGVLLHGLYLGGVWWAIGQGLPAGISALLAALQPLFTAALAFRLTGERLSPVRWTGVLVGLAGVLIVIAPKFAGIDPGALAALAGVLAVNVVAMVAVTAGSFYQKKKVATGDLVVVTVWQYVGALMVTLPLALILEPLRFEINARSLGALAWSVVALSMLGISMMLFLIREGSVARVSTLNFLVPPVAAIIAYLMFSETLTPVQVAGMVVTAVGVFLANRPDPGVARDLPGGSPRGKATP